MILRRAALAVLVAVVPAACGDDGTLVPADPSERLAGGDTTVIDEGRRAFAQAARNLAGDRRDRFFVGNALFSRGWVTAPASTTGLDGLGPTFNATSCAGCHLDDGRGAPPEDPEDPLFSVLVRLSGAPAYGGQLGPRAIDGVPPEGTARFAWRERPGAYGDGEPYVLLEPTIELADLAFGPLPAGATTSARVAPAMIGLGLLEAIPEARVRALADPDDVDGDGISGRAQETWDPLAGALALGRFGWKAGQAGVAQQNAGALAGDLGITSPDHPDEDCPAPQVECAAAPTGGAPEIDDRKLEDLAYYARLLAVPARRDVDDPAVLLGRARFRSFGCATCHVPSHVTALDALLPELEGQTIWPYTDLLLHDLGDGLADGRPEALADGREWRTPPLWGLGLIQVVNRHDRLLHDGRARGPAEAILWHDGEAAAARDAFRDAPPDERAALIAFLRSL